MFGHAAIHETVYNRLTDEDVDWMLRHNGRLGQAFNSFYGISGFVSGSIDTVLGSITDSAYSSLEPKIQSGLYRYISEKTSGDNAGKWLGTVFGIDTLKAKTSIASIVSDVTLWTGTIMSNESLRRVISLSATTVNWFATNTSSVYTDFITEVCTNTDATMDLFTSLILVDGLTTFMNTEAAVTVMAANENSMKAVTYMVDPFAAMIASETAMTAVAASEVAVNVIIESFTNVANSQTVLDSIKENLTAIEGSLPSIANSELNISEVGDVKTNIANVILSLQKTTTQADILIANITALVASNTAMTAIVNNDTSLNAINNSEEACNALSNLLTNDTMVTSVSLLNNTYTIYEGICFLKTVRANNSILNTVVGYDDNSQTFTASMGKVSINKLVRNKLTLSVNNPEYGGPGNNVTEVVYAKLL